MVRLRSLLPAALSLFASLPILAATHVWTGTADDRFSNASNWIGGSPAGDASAAISFPASSRTTVTNDLSDLTVQSIALSATGFTINGNTIRLAANASLIDTSTGTNTIACNLSLAGDTTVSVSGSLILSGVIAGAGGVTMRGGGHLVYTGSQANTYSGLTRVLFGELQLKKSPNVNAISGNLEVENDGFNYAYGSVSIFNDEQIANSSHVTVGYLATVNCGATETLGPITLTRFSELQTTVPASGGQLTGKIILAGDIEITGNSQGDIRSYGTFLLQGIRTITATANFGTWVNYSGPGQAEPGAGIILNGSSFSDGTYASALDFTNATYDGPTVIKGGSVKLDAPLSAVAMENGRYSGRCKSLTATGGVLNLHSYLGGVTSLSDVKLSSSVILGYEVGYPLKMNGALDLGGATLQIDTTSAFNYGAVYKVVDNADTKPVAGTFANLPEGSMIASRYKISYMGGDGNDVTLTDFGLIPSTVSLDISPAYPQAGTSFSLTAGVSPSQSTGSVTFYAGTNVLGTASVTNGTANLTTGTSLQRGHYVATAVYSGDSRVAPASSSARDLYVVAPKPTLTSIEPSTIPAGVKTTLTIHGTNFVNGSFLYFSSFGNDTTFVSPTELRTDFTPNASESDYPLEVWVSQPDPYGTQESGHVTLNVTGVTKPPSPFTFASDLTATVKGVTPNAMTFWFAVARRGAQSYNFSNIVNDTDHDGSVTLKFPFNVTALPPYGVWLVADLNAHTIVADNPSHIAFIRSPFPAKVFLRDSAGHYTHIQFAWDGLGIPAMFGWARPGVGAWTTFFSDGAALDEDDGPNARVTFETSTMQKSIGTTVAPPADGVRPGDMFLVIDFFGQVWIGDSVDSHLAESDGPGKLGFAVRSSDVVENSGTAKILVERTEGTDGAVTVQYATTDDSAKAGRNYAAQAGTLTFNAGEIFKTISIPLIDDSSYGGDVQFKVNLSNAGGAAIGIAAHTVTIKDDEAPPVVSLQPPSSVAEGDAGQIDLPVTVTLTGRTSLPVSVNWSWSEEASFGSHTGELQFASGETQKTFVVSYAANTTPEPNRRINLHLFFARNATESSDSSITIIDDDFATVSLADASVTENAGKVVVPLQLSRSSNKPISVSYETRNGTALAGMDYTMTSGTVTIDAGPATTIPSITIPIVDDNFHEPLKEFEVVLTSITGGKIDRSTAVVIIVDDDPNGAAPPPIPTHRRTSPH